MRRENTRNDRLSVCGMMCRAARQVARPLFLLAPCRILCGTAVEIFSVWMPQYLLQSLSDGIQWTAFLLQYLLLMLGWMVLCGLSGYTGSALYWNARPLRFHFLRAINARRMEMDYQHLLQPETQKLLANARLAIQADGSPTQNYFATWVGLLSATLSFLVFGAALALQNPLLSVGVLATAVVNYLVMVRVRTAQHRDRTPLAQLERGLEYLFKVSEAEGQAKDLRIYGMGEWLLRRLAQLTTQRDALARRGARRQWAQLSCEALLLLLRDGAAYLLLIARVASGQLSPQRFVFYVGAISQISASVMTMIQQYNKLRDHQLQLGELQTFLAPEATAAPGRPLPDADGPYTIEFRDVSFRYTPEGPWILRHIDLRLEKGQSAALIGVNGAGKSTLSNLLCGLLHPTEGQVLLNGLPLEAYDNATGFFGAVFQDLRLLPVSVAENISCRSLAQTDTARVEACLAKAGMAEKVAALPKGLHTPLVPAVQDEGVYFSGGEVQKLALARAVYRDAPVLLLDEPTAALDAAAESALYQQYNTLKQGKAVLFVTHRLASTQFCDVIFLLDGGGIVQQGTHAQLLAAEGLYRTMFLTQSQYYRPAQPKGEVTVDA